jgi:hypothetical protein
LTAFALPGPDAAIIGTLPPAVYRQSRLDRVPLMVPVPGAAAASQITA